MTREEKVKKIIKIAQKYLEIPYKRAAKYYEAPDVFNYPIFTRFVFEHIGKSLSKKQYPKPQKGTASF